MIFVTFSSLRNDEPTTRTSGCCTVNRSVLKRFCDILADIKLSIEGNGLCTSVHYKPTDSRSYLLYSSSHPSHVKNSIPYSQFLRLSRLCSEDSENVRFFRQTWPSCLCCSRRPSSRPTNWSAVMTALQTSQKEKNNIIPFTLTFHPDNHAVKSIIRKNFQNYFKMIPILPRPMSCTA